MRGQASSVLIIPGKTQLSIERKTMNSKRAVLTVIWTVLLLLGSASRAEAQARNGFTDATLNDRYGFHVLALSLGLPDVTTGASIPFAVSGYYQFNGDGTLSGKDTVSRQGSIVERSYTGTYHVSSDGTGTLKLDISPTFHPVGHFTIVDNGKAVEIIFAVFQNLNTFTLHQQSPN
jgi:hypothetical protein